ncbi:hypothetical protein FRB99_006471 [Tulasnella sp. 403]|nr:hypothetical protein FRB99_006471 [Tulasnella sp. 403]
MLSYLLETLLMAVFMAYHTLRFFKFLIFDSRPPQIIDNSGNDEPVAGPPLEDEVVDVEQPLPEHGVSQMSEQGEQAAADDQATPSGKTTPLMSLDMMEQRNEQGPPTPDFVDQLLERTARMLIPCWGEYGNGAPGEDGCFTRQLSDGIGRETVTSRLGLKLRTYAEDLVTQYNRTKDASLLDRARHILAHGLSLQPMDDERLGMTLASMGTVLIYRFRATGDKNDQDTCIECYKGAYAALPSGHHLIPPVLSNLSGALGARFRQTADPDDLEFAIEAAKTLLSLSSDPSHRLPDFLANLALIMRLHYELTGHEEDITECIGYCEEVLSQRPVGHLGRAEALRSLAVTLRLRFHSKGDRNDMEKSTTLLTEAVQQKPIPSTVLQLTLSDLGCLSRIKFDLLGDMGDLEASIRLHETALSIPHGSRSGRIFALSSLADSLRLRSYHTGNMDDLNQAVSHHSEVLEFEGRSGSSPDRAIALNNLGGILRTRFEASGDLDDLNKAIDHHEEAKSIFPPKHPNHAISLNNLGTALLARFDQKKDKADLEGAVACFRESLRLRGAVNPDRVSGLNNLGIALTSLFELGENLDDIDAAIESFKEAHSLLQPKHPEESRLLRNLANSYKAKFDVTENGEELDLAISHFKKAEECCTPNHPAYSSIITMLAMALHRKIRSNKPEIDQTADLDNVVSLLENASTTAGSTTMARLQASCYWALACRNRPVTAMKACSTMLHLLDVATARGHSLELRHQQLSSDILMRAKRLVVEAAAYAINQGDVPRAVEFLEHGRVLLLTQLSRYRTPLDALREVNSGLAERFSRISRQLDALASVAGGTIGVQTAKNTFEDNLSRYRRLTAEWDQVVDEIRHVEGFQTFLQPTPFAHLKKAAEHGPIIIVNIAVIRSDAIIVTQTGDLVVVPLPSATPDIVERLSNNFSRAVKGRLEREILTFLHEVWAVIVGPIADVLQGELRLPKKSRVWWYPTPAVSRLPLHAAGDPFKKDQNFADLYISSYTPTLGALIRAREGLKPCPGLPSMLAVGQPATPGEFAGFRSVVGTMWAMVDADGPKLADGFYRSMFIKAKGKRAEVDCRKAAFALREAVKALRKDGVPPIRWINFVHYGA